VEQTDLEADVSHWLESVAIVRGRYAVRVWSRVPTVLAQICFMIFFGSIRQVVIAQSL
jgi:hypothetical protein